MDIVILVMQFNNSRVREGGFPPVYGLTPHSHSSSRLNGPKAKGGGRNIIKIIYDPYLGQNGHLAILAQVRRDLEVALRGK